MHKERKKNDRPSPFLGYLWETESSSWYGFMLVVILALFIILTSRGEETASKSSLALIHYAHSLEVMKTIGIQIPSDLNLLVLCLVILAGLCPGHINGFFRQSILTVKPLFLSGLLIEAAVCTVPVYLLIQLLTNHHPLIPSIDAGQVRLAQGLYRIIILTVLYQFIRWMVLSRHRELIATIITASIFMLLNWVVYSREEQKCYFLPGNQYLLWFPIGCYFVFLIRFRRPVAIGSYLLYNLFTGV